MISTRQVRDLGNLMDPLVLLHQGRVLLNRTLAEIGARIRMTHTFSAPAVDARTCCSASPPSAASGRCGAAPATGRSISRFCSTRSSRDPTSRRPCSQPREVYRERPGIVAASRCVAAQRSAARPSALYLHESSAIIAVLALFGPAGAGLLRRYSGRGLLSALCSSWHFVQLRHDYDEHGVRRPPWPSHEHRVSAVAGHGAREDGRPAAP